MQSSLTRMGLNFPLCLAPMVGLSHVALREVLRSYLSPQARTLWPTEMLNSRKLPFEDLSLTPETLRAPVEDRLVPQILGNEEKYIRLSVERLKAWGASAIDINMGCPVQKALKHNYGVALMGDVKYAAEVVKMTVQNTDLPVSVKLRALSGSEDSEELSSEQRLLDFVGALQEAGASWITLHPRTQAQQRRGVADWEQIKFLKKNISIPVIGNGDVQIAKDIFAMREQTGCDLVMAGRALAARPWMLWQLGEELGFESPSAQSGKAPRSRLEEGQEYGRSLQLLWQKELQYFGEALALRKFRFHVRTTSVWLPFGQTLYGVVCKAKNDLEMQEGLARFFDQEIEMSERTELRQ